MGQRSSTETLIGIFAAFFRQRTWSQAELARVVDASVRTTRRVLDELAVNGWPFEREEDHPNVFWSLPRGFLPGGVLLKPEQLDMLLRVVARSPESPERDALMAGIGEGLPKPAIALLQRVVPSRISTNEARMLPVIEDAVQKRHPLRIRYFSASRGLLADRVVSVQRVILGPPARCVVYCHDVEALRWFRLESMVDATAARDLRFVETAPEAVDSFVASSVDGFASGVPIRVAFRVRQPEARWVAGNLPEGLTAEWDALGLHIDTVTSGLETIARFVVGLGEAAVVETPELADAVRVLAEGAIASLQAAQGRQMFSMR